MEIINVKLQATENILVFRVVYKYKKTFLTQSTGDLSVESEWCNKSLLRISSLGTSIQPKFCRVYLKKTLVLIGTQRVLSLVTGIKENNYNKKTQSVFFISKKKWVCFLL